ncbi:MAG: Uma2 family endonuclease [Fimbriimonadales bacterium]|nr:Uma2 family endonuclease [Fimbriimonadales bacterium]
MSKTAARPRRPSTQARSHRAPATVARLKFTPELFHRLGELGILNDETRYELIEGDIYAMPPIGPEHSAAVERGARAFIRLEQVGMFHARTQNPLRLGDSEPIPDIAIVPGDPEDYLESHPTTALLVIEVAKTTLEYDREQKLPLYAQAGVPECWIVNLQERVLEVYREPAGSRYKSLRYYTPDESVCPLFAPNTSIAVASLMAQTVSI